MIEDIIVLEKGDFFIFWMIGCFFLFIIINMVSGMEGLIEGGRIVMLVFFFVEIVDSFFVGG